MRPQLFSLEATMIAEDMKRAEAEKLINSTLGLGGTLVEA
jgi:hypothetical protein